MRSWQWALALYDHVPIKRADMDTFTHADGDPCVELEAENQAMLLLDTGDSHKTPSGLGEQGALATHDLRRIQPASTSNLDFGPQRVRE